MHLSRLLFVFLFCLSVHAQARLAEPLPAATGWRAASIHVGCAGVWYAHVDQVVDAFGQPEVIAADDAGRLLVLSVYSGQWTAHSVVCDGLWLTPSRPADVDARVSGRELYAAGRAGSVHRVTMRPQPFARFSLESTEIGHAPGEEFHALIAADLIPGGQDELLCFGITGAVHRLVAAGSAGAFTMTKVGSLPGRVRDVVLLPAEPGETPTMIGASRSGHLLAMKLTDNGLEQRVVLREDCGLGRVAIGRNADFCYVTRDDGLLLRVGLRSADGRREVVFAGCQGLRGVASGRFFADDREAVAVYGYDQRVHMISREAAGRWSEQTVFQGEQRGHWLTVGELDGRNGTDELVATGFDGTIVLLAREPGYALPGAVVPAEEQPQLPARPKSRRWI